MKSRYPSRIVVIDDDDISRRGLTKALTSFGHEVEAASEAVEGRARLRLGASLLVLDADMPAMDGFDLARELRDTGDFNPLPILMVTGLSGDSHRQRAVDVGIDDFISKPWEVLELFLRSESLLRTHKLLARAQAEQHQLSERVGRLETDLRTTLDDLARAQKRSHDAHLAAVEVLIHAAEYKDSDTAAHQARMRWYADAIGRALGLAPREVELIREGCAMHDVGKIGIPDHILLKPGRLTEQEREIMQKHTVIGAQVLSFSTVAEVGEGRVIARSHHERWDGRGYPDGLRGTDIPLSARICAVADVFDALTMDRVYRPALTNDKAREIMTEGSGSHFDPDVLRVFMDQMTEIEQIQAKYSDSTPELEVT